MNDVPDTELFSAYLDGELTADEQVRVEQILAASPEARQLVEELRALGSTLQALPQQKLDEDLSARVLQVAERRMLLPDDAGNKPSVGRAAEAVQAGHPVLRVADSTGGRGPVWRELSWRGMFSRRALIWSAVVVITAIIISFNTPQPKPKNNLSVHGLARLDKPAAVGAASPVGNEPSAPSTGAPGTPGRGNWEAPAGQPRKLPAGGWGATDASGKAADAPRTSPPKPTGDSLAAADTKDLAKSAVEHDRLKEKEEVARARESLAPEKKAEVRMAGGEHRPVAEKPSAAVALGAAAGEPAAGPVADKADLDVTAGKSGDGKKLVMRDGTELRSKSAGKRAARKAAKEAPANGEPFQAQAFREESQKAAPSSEAMARNQLMNGTGSAAAATADDGQGGRVPLKPFAGQKARATTYIRLDVTTQAVQDKVFEKLLDDNGLRSDQYAMNRNATDVAQKASAGNSIRRSVQMEQGNLGGSQDLNRQQNVATDNSSQAIGASQWAPAKSASSGSLTQQRRLFKPMIYEFDASPRQLGIIIKHLGEKSDSFTVTQTASPAAGTAKQHVVFVLNVVDHLPPAADRDSQTPAAPPPK